MAYHSDKMKTDKMKSDKMKTDRSKIIKKSKTGRRRLTEKEKKLLDEHVKANKHTKGERFKMVKEIAKSSKKCETKKDFLDLHKKLFSKK